MYEDNYNEDLYKIILTVFAVIILILCTIKIVLYFIDGVQEIKYCKMEVRRAVGKREIKHWKRELSAARWSLLPGITPHRVHKIRRFFYRGKHQSEKNDTTLSLLAVSLIGMLICGTCLAGSSFAWFTATKTTPSSTVNTASYKIVSIVSDGQQELMPDLNGQYSLSVDKVYKVILTADGEANTGYAKICFDDELKTTLITQQITKGTTINFDITVDKDILMCVNYSWGTSIRYTTPDIKDQDIKNIIF